MAPFFQAMFCLLMSLVAYCDVKYMKIPNILPLGGLVLFVTFSLTLPFDMVVWRLAAASIAFLVVFVLFSLRLIGGGDTKMLPVLILFVPTGGLITFAYIFSAAMLIGSLLTVVMQRLPVFQGAGLTSVSQKGHFPMGIAIAIAGIGQLILLG